MTELDKPKGKRVSYHFNTGERLHLFNVTEQNISGLWHRVTSDGKLYVIDPSKVLYLYSEEV